MQKDDLHDIKNLKNLSLAMETSRILSYLSGQAGKTTNVLSDTPTNE